MNSTIEQMNYQTYKEGYARHKEANIKLFQTLLKVLPREIIIDELKRRKILKYDWDKEELIEVKE